MQIGRAEYARDERNPNRFVKGKVPRYQIAADVATSDLKAILQGIDDVVPRGDNYELTIPGGRLRISLNAGRVHEIRNIEEGYKESTIFYYHARVPTVTVPPISQQ
jgi:hypothetical protein